MKDRSVSMIRDSYKEGAYQLLSSLSIISNAEREQLSREFDKEGEMLTQERTHYYRVDYNSWHSLRQGAYDSLEDFDNFIKQRNHFLFYLLLIPVLLHNVIGLAASTTNIYMIPRVLDNDSDILFLFSQVSRKEAVELYDKVLRFKINFLEGSRFSKNNKQKRGQGSSPNPFNDNESGDGGDDSMMMSLLGQSQKVDKKTEKLGHLTEGMIPLKRLRENRGHDLSRVFKNQKEKFEQKTLLNRSRNNKNNKNKAFVGGRRGGDHDHFSGEDFEARKRKLLAGSRGKSYVLLAYTMIPITVFANTFNGLELMDKMTWTYAYTSIQNSIIKLGNLQLTIDLLYTKAYHELSIVPEVTKKSETYSHGK